MAKAKMNITWAVAVGCLALLCGGCDSPVMKTAAGLPSEAELTPFIGEAKLETSRVFKGGRFANVVVATDGTVVCLINGVRARRSEDGGKTWGPEIPVGKGFMGGGLTVNEVNGEILAFVESGHPPAPLTVYRSKDQGKTWVQKSLF